MFANWLVARLDQKKKKRFFDGIFSLWDIPEQDVQYFCFDFANTFHPTVKFTFELSPTNVVFLD